jgi:hypothetical protein
MQIAPGQSDICEFESYMPSAVQRHSMDPGARHEPATGQTMPVDDPKAGDDIAVGATARSRVTPGTPHHLDYSLFPDVVPFCLNLLLLSYRLRSDTGSW